MLQPVDANRPERKIVAVGLTIVLSLGLGGCETLSSLNPFSDDEEEEDEPAELVDFPEEAEVDVVWTSQVGDGSGSKYFLLVPAIGSGRIYAADSYGEVAAFDLATGDDIWQAQVGEVESAGFWSSLQFWKSRDNGFVSGAIGQGDGVVMLGTTQGDVFALDDLSGNLLWRSRVSSEVIAPPQTNGDVVVLQTLDGKLIALDRESGERRWSYDTQVPVLTLRGASPPVFAGELVICGFPNGRVVALRANGGEPVWEQRIALPQGRSELDRMVDIDGTPLVEDGVLYVASYQGRIKALRLTDGSPLWERELSSHQSIASGLEQLYVVGKDDQVAALDRRTSTPAWQSDLLKRRGLTSPTVVDNFVVVGDAEGYVHVFTQSEGRMVARDQIDSDGLRSDMRVSNGIVYGLSVGGTLFAFKIERNS